MVWRYIWNVMELALIFVAWVLFFDYESDGDYDFPVKIEDYEEPKKKQIIRWIQAAIWVLVLFGLIVGTMILLDSWGVINTPMGIIDSIIVFITVAGSVLLISNLRNQWRLLND